MRCGAQCALWFRRRRLAPCHRGMSGSMLLCYESFMSEITTQADRDAKNGRFLPGNSGFGGRPKGSRNKLSENFLADLHDCWERFGPQALERCATEDPAAFCKILAGLMPRDVNLNVGVVDAMEFAEKFRSACEMLGNEPPPRPRRPLRIVKAINRGG
jgi:hypothetical protein